MHKNYYYSNSKFEYCIFICDNKANQRIFAIERVDEGFILYFNRLCLHILCNKLS